MSAYLREAAYLAAETPHNRCPATDALAVLDEHPEIRLALEDTWTDDHGRVYREVPADRISRWPGAIARAFRPLMRIARDPAPVLRLLDLLHRLEADPAVVRMTLAACRKRQSLNQAIAYYETLAAALDEVTCGTGEEEISLGDEEPSCRPRYRCGEVEAGSWHLPGSGQKLSGPPMPPCYRPELLHDPQALAEDEPDWVERQPRAWRRLHEAIRTAPAARLSEIKKALLDSSSERWSREQLEVLWDAYRIRRDRLRCMRTPKSTESLGPVAKAVLRRIRSARSRSDVARLGVKLYRAMKGEIPLPGPVTESEWTSLFECYRTQKARSAQAR